MSKCSMKAKIAACVIAISMVFGITMQPVEQVKAADSTIVPTADDNLVHSLRKYSYLTALDSGFMRVHFNGIAIGIEYYDNSFNIQSKKNVAMELPYWGGFYAASDGYYYVVEGQANTDEVDTLEVIRVIKYDKNWNRIKAAAITGTSSYFGKVRYPFDYGCVEMAEYNNNLYIVTGHEGYVDPAYNQGHQGFLMIEVNQSSMTGKIVDCDLWHSFAQYIEADGSNLYVLEQSEGSRCTSLTKYTVGSSLSQKSIPVLEYGGSRTSAWAIACYASVDDLAVSTNNILCLGTSIDQSQYDNVNNAKKNNQPLAHNIYLTVTPKSNFTQEATTVKWLTNYSGDGKGFTGLQMTKVNNNRFLISWDEWKEEQTADPNDPLSGYVMHYVFIDENGNAVSQVYTAAAPVSDCHPIVKGNKIYYYASNASAVDFYTIDATSGALTKKVYRVAGENASWDYNQGVLTVSGTGSVKIDGETHYRYPISSTAGGYSYSSYGSAWTSLRTSVNKIVIKSGITEISEKSFTGFSSLTEVEIQPGLTSIGSQAFYGNNSLRKITIPPSVTSIGDDFLWTGYYWVGSEGHVTRATVYAKRDSYAAQYATEHNISLYIEEEPTSPTVPTSPTEPANPTNPTVPTGPVDQTKTEAFVTRLYNKCLEREPEAEGLEHWNSVLVNRERTGAQVAYGFVFSKEYTQKNTSDDAYVEMLYNVFMDRASDAGGKAHWMELLANGVSREYVFRGFAQSQEYTNICNSYNIERGTVTLTQARDKNPKLTAYVNRMYTQALGRAGEEDGLNHWCKTIQQGVKTPEQVAESFINSKEFKNKNLSNEEYIKVLYRTFMGREYDQAGLEHWKNELARGCTREEILHRFATSKEFKNIQASFGL